MPGRSINKRGFTLIELLVVVAIISIVAAILFPVFAKVREKGRQSVCASNLKQIGLAWQLYSQDYDDTNVIGNYFSPDFSTFYAWFGTILPSGRVEATKGFISPYTAGSFVLHDCPSADLKPLSLPGPGAQYGYGVNEALYPNMAAIDPADQPISVPLSKVENPAETILIADSAIYFNFGQPALYSEYSLFMPSDQANGGPTVHALHIDHANVLWYDGHVRSQRVTPMEQMDLFMDPPAVLKENHLGYVMQPGCAVGDPCQDYYYKLDK